MGFKNFIFQPGKSWKLLFTADVKARTKWKKTNYLHEWHIFWRAAVVVSVELSYVKRGCTLFKHARLISSQISLCFTLGGGRSGYEINARHAVSLNKFIIQLIQGACFPSPWNDVQRVSINFSWVRSFQCDKTSMNLLRTLSWTINNSNFRGKPCVFHGPEFLIMPWKTHEKPLNLCFSIHRIFTIIKNPLTINTKLDYILMFLCSFFHGLEWKLRVWWTLKRAVSCWFSWPF